MAAAAILNLLYFIDFGHTIYLWLQPTTLLPNFINPCQLAAELLLLCKNPRWRPPSWILFLFNILACLYVGPQK